MLNILYFFSRKIRKNPGPDDLSVFCNLVENYIKNHPHSIEDVSFLRSIETKIVENGDIDKKILFYLIITYLDNPEWLWLVNFNHVKLLKNTIYEKQLRVLSYQTKHFNPVLDALYRCF